MAGPLKKRPDWLGSTILWHLATASLKCLLVCISCYLVIVCFFLHSCFILVFQLYRTSLFAVVEDSLVTLRSACGEIPKSRCLQTTSELTTTITNAVWESPFRGIILSEIPGHVSMDVRSARVRHKTGETDHLIFIVYTTLPSHEQQAFKGLWVAVL
ncbi:hypothetical protein GGS26DRAFT_555728 [Hypomontagnella submonticulosa]|nr:hypothetical protein GGS26DRAFT_555728 [Hypomontagnella submonticulosa]